VVTDIGLSGTNMSLDSSIISRALQHWSDTDGFSYSAGYTLQEVPLNSGPSTGCLDANLAAATSHSSLASKTLYWKLLVPENIKSGTYSGSNSISLITCQ
jgi:hypothetical protein